MANWFDRHYGLLMSLAGGVVFGLIGAYADTQRDRAEFFDKQADTLADAVIIARESLHNCPEAAKLIDEDVNKRHPNENNAPVEEALRYISKKAGLKCKGVGDDWPTAKCTTTKEHRRILIGKE